MYTGDIKRGETLATGLIKPNVFERTHHDTRNSTQKILGADIYAEAGAYTKSVLDNARKKATKLIDALIAAGHPANSSAQPIRRKRR